MHDRIPKKLACTVDILAEWFQAEFYAGGICVQQDAGDGEMVRVLVGFQLRRECLRQRTLAVCQEYLFLFSRGSSLRCSCANCVSARSFSL